MKSESVRIGTGKTPLGEAPRASSRGICDKDKGSTFDSCSGFWDLKMMSRRLRMDCEVPHIM